MTTLRNWLVANSHITTDPADVQRQLSEEVEVYRNSARLRLADVMDVIEPETALVLDRKLRKADLSLLTLSLVSGLAFDSPKTRRMLQSLVTQRVFEQTEVDALLALGLRYGPVWERDGLEALPTVEEIEAEQASAVRAEVAKEMYEVMQEATSQALSAAFRVRSEGGTTEQMRAAFDAELEVIQ